MGVWVVIRVVYPEVVMVIIISIIIHTHISQPCRPSGGRSCGTAA